MGINDGTEYTGERGTCYICGINQAAPKLIKLTAHEIFVLELYCKATNNTPPRGFTYFCKDRELCDKWVENRNKAMEPVKPAPEPVKPWPLPLHPNNTTKRSRNKYG